MIYIRILQRHSFLFRFSFDLVFQIEPAWALTSLLKDISPIDIYHALNLLGEPYLNTSPEIGAKHTKSTGYRLN